MPDLAHIVIAIFAVSLAVALCIILYLRVRLDRPVL